MCEICFAEKLLICIRLVSEIFNWYTNSYVGKRCIKFFLKIGPFCLSWIIKLVINTLYMTIAACLFISSLFKNDPFDPISVKQMQSSTFCCDSKLLMSKETKIGSRISSESKFVCNCLMK